MDVRNSLTNAGVELIRSSSIVRGVSISEWSGQNTHTCYEGANENVISLYQSGGKNCTQVNDQGRIVSRGFDQAVCIFPKDGMTSNWYIDGNLNFFHLYIDSEYFAKNLFDINDSYGDKFVLNDVFQGSDQIISSAMSSIALSDWGDRSITLGLEGVVNWILINLASSYLLGSKQQSRKTGCFTPKHRNKITDYLHDNLDSSINLNDMASEMHLSEFHFLKKFKNTFNETPYAFLTKIRMDKAYELLVKTDNSILEIALKCGYKQHNQFSTKFKKFYGFSPRNLRE